MNRLMASRSCATPGTLILGILLTSMQVGHANSSTSILGFSKNFGGLNGPPPELLRNFTNRLEDLKEGLCLECILGGNMEPNAGNCGWHGHDLYQRFQNFSCPKRGCNEFLEGSEEE